jgi:hypothetical protein
MLAGDPTVATGNTRIERSRCAAPTLSGVPGEAGKPSEAQTPNRIDSEPLH